MTIVSGTLAAAGAVLSFSPTSGVLGLALLISVLVLACIAAATAAVRRGALEDGAMATEPASSRPGIAAYERFLAARDGDPDLPRHTLSNREKLFADLAAHPVTSAFRPDRDQYLENMARHRPASGLDRRMLWILATAKSNQAERFAIGLAETYGRMQLGDDDRILLHIHLQETYHTRILADVVSLFGLPVQPRPPSLSVRVFIKRLVFAPPNWVRPLTGASEMAGCVLFRALRDIGCEVFADEPAVAERIRVLCNEILADEIGHVGYIAACLGPSGRRLMRRLYAILGGRLVQQLPEMRRLCTDEDWRRRFADFRLEELVGECAGLAYAAATI
jgi:hypothetical protein